MWLAVACGLCYLSLTFVDSERVQRNREISISEFNISQGLTETNKVEVKGMHYDN